MGRRIIAIGPEQIGDDVSAAAEARIKRAVGVVSGEDEVLIAAARRRLVGRPGNKDLPIRLDCDG